jgi:hypothetical protein
MAGSLKGWFHRMDILPSRNWKISDANGFRGRARMSLTRRRESAKWEKASLLRVSVFDSDILRHPQTSGEPRGPRIRKKGREEEDSEITLLCAFASSREALFSSPDASGGSLPDAAERPTTKSGSIRKISQIFSPA